MNSNVCVYSFADATGLTKYIDSVGDYTFVGTWSSTGTYLASPLTAVDYGNALYMCIRDNVGDNPQRVPTRTRPQSWSVMSLLYEYSTCGTETSVGLDAYNLAVSGTNIAWAAYYLAQIGTNTGSAAYDLAGSAYALAGSAYGLAGSAYTLAGDAYYLAQIGTNIANDAYTIAVAGTGAAATAQSTADAAYLLAQIGTNTGTAALNAAASAQSTANGAFLIAVAGTNAAASAQSTADAAYLLAQIGTNTGSAALDAAATAQSTADSAYFIAEAGTNAAATAQSTADTAYAIAQLGTIPPPLSTLPDVSIPAPTANQILTFNGSVWVAAEAPTQVAPGAFTLFLEDSASGTAGYSTLLPVPSGMPEDSDAVLVGGTLPFVFVEGYISNPINRTRIDAGLWEFNNYVSTGSITMPVNIVTEIYIRDISGVETYLFAGTGGPATSETAALTTNIVSYGSYITSLTDKIVAKYYFLRSDSPMTTAALYHSGSLHDSHFHTPIGFAHNDLGGLQGGATDQFYHTTLDQNNALTGNLGYPSASNPFVTVQGLNYASGTLSAATQSAQSTADAAYGLAQTGTNAAASAQSTADAAYLLAQVGTNTGTAAYQLAESGSNYAAAAYALAQIGTAIPNFGAGGTMTGNLKIPNMVVGVGTVPVSEAVSGTMYYDMTGPAYQITTASSPFWVSAKNLSEGAEICAVIVSDGTGRSIGYTGSFAWFGTLMPFTPATANNKILVAMTCISATGTNVIGGIAVQI